MAPTERFRMECSFSADSNTGQSSGKIKLKTCSLKAISGHAHTINHALLPITKFITQLNNLASGTQAL